ncbi:MAG: L-fucokinase [Lentisphaeria bacterium]|nr:L-fucokinase [Lentisphaeria bacterium]
MRIDFFHQAHLNNWERYLATLKGERRAAVWDWVILTSSNEKQARAYRYQIALREKLGMLPSSTRFLVVPDPEGVRIGSGGATLNVLVTIAGMLEEQGEKNPFSNRKILILHSGGDSKRLPQYSAFGKIFSPIPRLLDSGRPSTLFDELFVGLSGIPAGMSPGIVIASGDVLLLFDHTQLDVSRPGFTGVAIRADAAMASHHGVFVPDQHGRVRRFLHKPSPAEMRRCGALDQHDMAPVDTGIIYFGAKTAERLRHHASGEKGWLNRSVKDAISINFYGDFLLPLAPDSEYDDYLADTSDGPATPELREIRTEIWDVLRETPFYVSALEPAKFLHFGTTREYQRLITYDDQDIQALGGCRRVSHYAPPTAELAEKSCVLHSHVGEHCHVAPGATLEFSKLGPNVSVGQDAVVSNVTVPEHVAIPEGCVIHGLPLMKDNAPGFSVRFWGVDDNPKDHIPEATLFARPLTDWLEKLHLAESDVWPGAASIEEKTLWKAKLFPVCETQPKAWEALRPFLRLAADWQGAPAADFPPGHPRMSLAESSSLADLERIGEEHQRLFMDMVADKCRFFFEREKPVLSWLEKIPTSADLHDLHTRFYTIAISASPSLANARFSYSTAALMDMGGDGDQTRRERLENLAFSHIAQCMLDAQKNQPPDIEICQWRHDTVTARFPVRIDFAGGWSDTPPFCLEKGGTVLNAAIMINGALPIQVTAERLDEPVVTLVSEDLDVSQSITGSDELLDFSNPHDPLALHKAATCLVLGGLSPRPFDLEKRLTAMGGGLRLASVVNLPKGTGLGTSSVLAAALIKAIWQLGSGSAADITSKQLFDAASMIEQMLTTGGGWQDQVGGGVPGVKLTTSAPGNYQHLTVTPVTISPANRRELDERLVILDTGQRRLAKNLLRDIMGSWLRRDPRTVNILRDIQILAREAVEALETGNFFGLGQILWRHWELNKQLDPGTTNPLIDSLVDTLRPYLEGAKLAGAGGGGFLMGIAKPGCRERIRSLIESEFAHANIRYYDARIQW